MTALLGLISWKWVAVVGAGLVGVISAWLHGRSSGAEKATAAAQADITTANAQRDEATVQAASAQAAVSAVQTATVGKQQIDSDVAKVAATPGALDKTLTDEGYTE